MPRMQRYKHFGSHLIDKRTECEMSAIRSMESTHTSSTILRCKVAVIGDATVGKSALLQVLKSQGHEYPKNYVMTTGVELCVKSFPIADSNFVVELYLLDCAGQSIFNQREFGAVHYQGASLMLIVFDIDSKESFKSVGKWYQDVLNTSLTHQIAAVFVGNKLDLRVENNREAVAQSDAESWAEQHDMKYFEVSALENKGVEAPFLHIAQWFHERYTEAATKD